MYLRLFIHFSFLLKEQEKMAQRFPVPNTGSNGPPPQRYPPSSVPPNLRQYSGPNFPVSVRFNSNIMNR